MSIRLTGFEKRNPNKAISEGYDRTVGIAHEGDAGSSKFIAGLMEAKRSKVDGMELDSVEGTFFQPADFVIRAEEERLLARP